MIESELKKKFNCPIHPADIKKTTNKGFVINVNGSIGWSHWSFFLNEKQKIILFRQLWRTSQQVFS